MDIITIKRILKTFLYVLICVSCSSQVNQSSFSDVDVDVKELSGLNQIFDKYRYVRLQTPDTRDIKQEAKETVERKGNIAK